jgi:hypothetical protein
LSLLNIVAECSQQIPAASSLTLDAGGRKFVQNLVNAFVSVDECPSLMAHLLRLCQELMLVPAVLLVFKVYGIWN